jgi:hypothetical protein
MIANMNFEREKLSQTPEARAMRIKELELERERHREEQQHRAEMMRMHLELTKLQIELRKQGASEDELGQAPEMNDELLVPPPVPRIDMDSTAVSDRVPRLD